MSDGRRYSDDEVRRIFEDAAEREASGTPARTESSSVSDETDGLSFEFDDWRFNLRPSNTEPVLRLNVESRGDVALMTAKTEELLDLIDRV